MRPSGRGPGPQTPEQRARRVFALLVLACLSVITLDAKAGDGSPLDPVRSAVGNVVGPMESATATAVRPFTDLNDAFRTNHGLREDVARLIALTLHEPATIGRQWEVVAGDTPLDDAVRALVASA